MARKIKEKILELRELGYSYGKIQDELKCSKSAISYHCGVGQKEKTKTRKNIHRKTIIGKLGRKIERFSNTHLNLNLNTRLNSLLKCRITSKIVKYSKMSNKNNAIYTKPSFTSEDLLNKIGENPVCYLTGNAIDIKQTRSWHLDHIKPRSRGGNNTIENANICTRDANQAKSDMELDDFFELCKSVLEHNGYNVEKKILTD